MPRRARGDDPVEISLSFDVASQTFSAAASYRVGGNTRVRATFANGRIRAIKRMISIFRKNGHGGRKFVATDESGARLAGVVPTPGKRLVIEEKQGKLIK